MKVKSFALLVCMFLIFCLHTVLGQNETELLKKDNDKAYRMGETLNLVLSSGNKKSFTNHDYYNYSYLGFDDQLNQFLISGCRDGCDYFFIDRISGNKYEMEENNKPEISPNKKFIIALSQWDSIYFNIYQVELKPRFNLKKVMTVEGSWEDKEYIFGYKWITDNKIILNTKSEDGQEREIIYSNTNGYWVENSTGNLPSSHIVDSLSNKLSIADQAVLVKWQEFQAVIAELKDIVTDVVYSIDIIEAFDAKEFNELLKTLRFLKKETALTNLTNVNEFKNLEELVVQLINNSNSLLIFCENNKIKIKNLVELELKYSQILNKVTIKKKNYNAAALTYNSLIFKITELNIPNLNRDKKCYFNNDTPSTAPKVYF